MLIIMGHEYIWVTMGGGENQQDREGERESILRDKRKEVYYIFTYEDSITEPTK
jgi:hypothetical protein